MKLSMMTDNHGNKMRQSWTLGSAILLLMVLYPLNAFSGTDSEPALTTTANSEASATQVAIASKTQSNIKPKAISRLALLESAHQKSPQDVAIAAQLATVYIQTARTESDSSYYLKANKAIEAWKRTANIPGLPQKEVPLAMLLVRATLLQHDHHYLEASDDLLKVVRKQPTNAQAWLTLSTIQLVQGDYQKARVSCSALSRVSSNWIASLCYSQIYSFTGSAERALGMQQQLLQQLQGRKPQFRLWISGLMAETAMRLGNNKQAEEYFKLGVTINPNDTYILRSYSDFLLTQGRSKDVIKLLKSHQENDQLILRYAIAVKDQGETEQAKQLQAELESRFETAIKRHNHSHGRDEALFLLAFKADQPEARKRALKLAVSNWESQKEPDDALTLLRAAKLSDDKDGLKQVKSWIEQHKLQDVRLQKIVSET